MNLDRALNPFGFSVVDDRGVRRRLSGSTLRRALPLRTDSRVGAAYRRAEAAVERPLRERFWLWLIATVCPIVSIVLSVVLYVLVDDQVYRYHWLILVAGFGLAACVVGVLHFYGVSRCAPAFAEAFLDEGICPSCGYNLFGLADEHDGCVQCPECGLAWRHERLRRREPYKGEVDSIEAIRNMLFSAEVRNKRFAIDARGRQVALIKPRFRIRDCHPASDDHRARLRAARRRVGKVGLVFRALCGGFLYVVGLIAIIGAVLDRHHESIPVLIIFFGGGGTLLLCGNYFYSSRGIVTAMLKHRICPACAGSVDRIIRSDDEDRASPRATADCRRCLCVWEIETNPEECPSCDYDLRGVPFDQGRTRTCPECGVSI